MKYVRMAIEKESPEQLGYDKIKYNLTESSIRDRSLSDFGVVVEDMLLPYGDHFGKEELREVIAAQWGKPLTAENILVTSGAAGALFIIATSLLEKGDHIVVVRPNYATNIETPRAIGCDISYVDLIFEEGYRVDVEKVESFMNDRTKLISFTSPHNPTGTVLREEELKVLVDLAERRGCWLLLDETYRELAYGKQTSPAATLSDRAISVSSMSKSYGIPGIRIGWLATQDPELYELFLSAKEQIGICGSVVDEEIAFQVLKNKDTWMPQILEYNKKAFNTMKKWIESEEAMEWVEPEGGVVCFPRIKPSLPVDIDLFYDRLNNEYGTYVGPGHWFEMPRNYMRIGYAWPLPEELEKGLEGISLAIKDSLKAR